MLRTVSLLLILLVSGFASLIATAADGKPFGVRVVDGETKRGVPLVELVTTAQEVFITDSLGWVTIREPELVGREVHFAIRSPGYETPKDGFGIVGQRLKIEPGKTATITLTRRQPAERLYRTTGLGIYRAACELGIADLPPEPSAAAGIAGCDSVLVTRYGGKLHWFWGDTPSIGYPLGNFHMTGATTALPAKGLSLSERPPHYRYFLKPEGGVKSMMPMPGDGPTWMGGLVTLKDETGRERMVAGYSKIRGSLESYRWGLEVWSDELEQFEPLVEFPAGKVNYPVSQNHTLLIADGRLDDAIEDDGYLYFCQPFPLMRVKRNLAAMKEIGLYEGYTCEVAGSTEAEPKLERDTAGKLVHAWRPGVRPVTAELVKSWCRKGFMQPEESLFLLPDRSSGDAKSARMIQPHYGSTYWNAYRRKYVTIFSEINGAGSMLGNVWYTEADSITGPWRTAIQLADHGRYSFYNPRQHPDFAEEGGKIIYFEGTFTQSFSGLPQGVPLYDYNQLMYRVDLSRLELPGGE